VCGTCQRNGRHYYLALSLLRKNKQKKSNKLPFPTTYFHSPFMSHARKKSNDKEDEGRIHYVNTESFWWYIVWRTCFYEDHSSYLPKYHAPLHAIYYRYSEISTRFNLAVDDVDPVHFATTVVQQLQESGNMYLSCYWDKTPSVRKRKRQPAPKEPCICAVINCDWAIKYERLLRSSIIQGCLELKVINGRPVVGNEQQKEGNQIGSSTPSSREEGSYTRVPSSTRDPMLPVRRESDGASFDHGEDPRMVGIKRSVMRETQTKMQQETLAFLKRVRASVEDFPLPEDSLGAVGMSPLDVAGDEERLVATEEKGKDPSGVEDEGEQDPSELLQEGEEVEQIQREFMQRMEELDPIEVEEELKVVISRKISKIHMMMERDCILRQIDQFSYSFLTTSK
jgi:hypothetical protein